MSKIVTPHAAVLIWNYKERVNSGGASPDPHYIEQVVIGTSSIISINTSKRKSTPAGQFEVRLAPRFNWVSRITPGSWCAILMSQSPIPTMQKGNVGTASKNSFKMLGRIDSVRGAVAVDQNTGARNTSFIITGRDWGSVFESNVYIDPIMSNNIFQDNAIAQAYSIFGLNMYKGYTDDKKMPSSATLVDNMIKLWGGGASGTAVDAGENLLKSNSDVNKVILSSKTQFRLPKEVAEFMRQGKSTPGVGSIPPKPIPGTTSVNFADIIKPIHGVLTGPDKYKTIDEAFGIPDPHNFFGTNTFWQLLTEVSNPTLNELVTDIRWESDGPKFALYHRIRPFIINEKFLKVVAALSTAHPTTLKQASDALSADSVLKDLISLYKNIKQVEIDAEDVVGINFGTNWRDKINFIELMPNSQLLDKSQANEAKIGGQTYDPFGYERDGFKPLITSSSFLPYQSANEPLIKDFSQWKFLLREWHFNNHMMVNGSMTIVGQDNYIQVGDNIKVDALVLGSAPLNTLQNKQIGNQLFLLAHVENISHTFSVNPENGARTFATTIEFVRGVITDKAGKSINYIDGNAIDNFADVLTGPEERNKNTFGTSVETDPDVQKLGKGIM